jgi:hypothetical protein
VNFRKNLASWFGKLIGWRKQGGTTKFARGRSRLMLEALEDRTVLNSVPLGSQFLVNEVLAPPESPPAVAIVNSAAGQGEFIAVWQTYGQDGDGFGIFAQLFNEDGSAITGQPAFQVNLPPVVGGPAVGNQLAPTVASDGAGNFVIAWQSENQATGDYDVYYRQGSFLGGTFTLQADAHQANTLYVSGHQSAPTAAMDASGNFVIAWQSQDLAHPELGYDIYAKQGTLAGGLSAGNELLVNTSYTTGDQTSAATSMNAQGDLVIAWRGPDPAAAGAEGEEVPAILFTVFYDDAGGLAHTSEVKANATKYNDIGAPDVAINASGTIIVGWQVEGQPNSGSDIFGRRFSFSSAGAPQVSPLATSTSGLNDFRLNTTTSGPQRAPSVGIDDAGDFFAAWQTQHQDGFSWAVFGKRYDATADAFGAESLINAGTQMGPQINPDIAMTAGGRTVVIWMGPDVPQGTEEGEGGHKPGIHAHIYDNAGLTSVGAGEVLLATYSAIEDTPSAAAMDAAGNYVVVWQSWEDTGDGSDFGIYAKLYQANGKPIDINENGLDDDRMLVNVTTAGSQSAPAVAMDQAGNFVVVWQSALQDGSGTGIYARRYNASYKAWEPEGELLVNVVTTGDQAKPKVAMDAAGNFVVVWQSNDGTNPDNSPSTGIFARRWDAALKGWSPQGEFRVNAEVQYDQVAPVISMNASGQFVVAWVGDNGVLLNPLDSEKSIFVQWFGSNGQALLATDYLANKYVKDAQEHPALAIAPNGNFVAAWQSINQEMNVEGVGNSWGVYANQFVVDAVAHKITTLGGKDELRVNETTDGPQRFPEVGIDQAGNFVVAWQSIRQDASSWAVLARQYNANGTASGGEALVNTYTSGPQILPVIAERGTGDFAIFWDGQAPGHLEGVSGQRFHFIRDDFNRGNFPSLGPDWTVRSGNYDIHDNVAAVQTALGIATLNKVSLADVSVEGYVTLGGGLTQVEGLVARYAGPGDTNMYWAGLHGVEGDFTAEIWRMSGGVWTMLARQAVDAGEGLMRFDLVGPSLKLFMNDKLVAFTTDSVISAPGLIGFRGSFDTTVDNFSYSALTAVNASMPFRDFFYLSDGSQLSAFWSEKMGNMVVQGYRATNNVPGTSLAVLNGVSESDVSVAAWFDLTAPTASYGGLLARYNTATFTGYHADVTRSGGLNTFSIYRMVNGGFTLLAQAKLAGDATGTLRLEVVGSSLKLFFRDGSNGDRLVAFARDTVVTAAGTVGLRVTGKAVTDDFAADRIVTVNATLPYTQGFDVAAAGQLGREWLEQVGNFTVDTTATKLLNNVPGTSLAVLNGVSESDVSVAAWFDLTAPTASYGGLLARYNTATATGYHADVTRSGGLNTFSIYRMVNGGFTLLAQAKLAGDATGTLRLEVVGSSLKLFFRDGSNGDRLVAFARDTVVTAAGTVGLRVTGKAVTDDFAADRIVTVNATLPYTQGFDVAAAGQLGREWLEQVGNFTVDTTATKLLNNVPGTSLAVLNGVSESDVSVAAWFDLTAPTASYGGLLARYNTATATGYHAEVTRSGGLNTFSIYRMVNGGFTLLAQAKLAGSATGTLKFEVIGTALKLYLDGSSTALLSVTDSGPAAISAAGTAGLRVTGSGVILDDVTVAKAP